MSRNLFLERDSIYISYFTAGKYGISSSYQLEWKRAINVGKKKIVSYRLIVMNEYYHCRNYNSARIWWEKVSAGDGVNTNTWLHVHKQADNSQNPPTLQRVTVYQFSRNNIYEFSNNNNNLYITFGDKNYGHITIKVQNTTYYTYISN